MLTIFHILIILFIYILFIQKIILLNLKLRFLIENMELIN